MTTNKNENTLKSWATGKIASFGIGLAVAGFLYKTGMIQKVIDLFTKKSTNQESKPNTIG